MSCSVPLHREVSVHNPIKSLVTPKREQYVYSGDVPMTRSNLTVTFNSTDLLYDKSFNCIYLIVYSIV